MRQRESVTSQIRLEALDQPEDGIRVSDVSAQRVN